MTTLQSGDMAPDFTLTADNGEQVTLSDLRGKRVVVYFYPADDTPGCTRQACNFRDAYPAIQEKNAVVLGISPDGTASHQSFKSKYDLPFTLLSDEDHAVADMYGVWGEKVVANREMIGLIRSHFVIDESGKIVEAHVAVPADESAAEAVAALG